MSIHFEISDEARQQMEKEKRVSTISSFIIAIVSILLLAMILGFFLLPNLGKDDIQIVTYKSNMMDEDEPQAEKVKTNVQRKPTAPSSSPVKTIVAMTTSPTSIPTVDAVEPVESMEFGEGDDFGTGWGDGTGFGAGGKGTAFGRMGGGGVEGKFYDLKQDRNKKPNANARYFESNGNIDARLNFMLDTYLSLEGKRFSDSALRDYYVSPNALSFSHLVMAADTPASTGPKAFGVEKEVDPSAWVVVYEGRIRPDKPGEYQFVGMFDDVLLVYIDDRLVLDGSFSSYSKMSQPAMPGAMMRARKPLIEGTWVRLTAGTKIKIVVGESPGGAVGGGLFIREKGKRYSQAEGGDVLPPFTTSKLTKEEIKKLKNLPKMKLPGNFPVETDDVPIFYAE